MTTTTITKQQRKLTDRARKREEAARKKRLAAAAKAIAEEEKAERAAPAIQRGAVVGTDGTVLRGARLEFDGKTHTVHRSNPIRTLVERGRNKENSLFKKAHSDAAQKLIALHDLCYGGVSSGVGSYDQRSSSMPQTGSIADAVLRAVNSQVAAKKEIEILHTHFGSSWDMLVAIVVVGIPISRYAEDIGMREEPAAGYLVSLLDRLVDWWMPPDTGRSRIRTIEFATQDTSST